MSAQRRVKGSTWSEEKRELLKYLAEAVKRAREAEERAWRRGANEYKLGMTGYVSRLVEENMKLRAQLCRKLPDDNAAGS